MSRRLSPDRIKLCLGIAAAVATAVFLGWRVLGFVEEVWGPEANPFAPRPAIVAPRPIERIKEFAPAAGSVVLRDVSYAAGAGDVPGWRVRADDRVAEAHPEIAAEAAPWRGSAAPAWRRPLAGQGNSSPIVVGERIVLTIADGGPPLRLVCVSLETGTDIWRQLVSREPFPPRHEKTSDAASTPCSDGERVFVAHATADAVHLSAFSLDGRSLWKTRLGPFTARWGFTCSPAWARGLVVVGADNPEEGFLAAVDGETGREVWRRRRPRAGDESYSSPVIVAAVPSGAAAATAAEPHVVMAGLGRIESHALGSGRTLWGTGGIAGTSGATAAVAGDICVATSGYPTRAMVALRMDPGGAAPAVLWKEDRDSEVPYVPSPLAHAGRLYVVHDDGMAHCRDLVTGKVVWKRRVGGTFTASPVLVNGELLCADESGRCMLLDLDDGTARHEFSLTGGCFATPVVVRGRLLVRTTQELVAFEVVAGPRASPRDR